LVEVVTFDEFALESGATFHRVPVAYQAWGTLNATGTNCVVVCHALTGNTNVADWWTGLLGPGRALDTDKYFVVCANVIGSPYGTLSPLTVDEATGAPYGPSFPIPTIRDTVNLHRKLLDSLGVRQVQFCIGGSMGGMQVLEWAFFGDYVRGLVPIAVGGRHSAWCIAWSEAQRHAIYSDPNWQGGHYTRERPPAAGLAVARMIAMVTYRSFDSFQLRFGREAAASPGPEFAMTSYLRYQGDKLVERFDANCYVRLTESMDSHDIARGRGDYGEVLKSMQQPALVVGIQSDMLYPLAEQRELAEGMPHAEFAVLDAHHGHDSFLIEVEELNGMVASWRHRAL
jgi:homoserine O-acetyltransferase